MTRRAERAIAHIRELQHAELAWREEHPTLARRFATLDLITSCGFQYYSDHAVEDDLRLLDHAVATVDGGGDSAAPSAFEQAGTELVRALVREVTPLRVLPRDLHVLERIREILVWIPPSLLLGRTDEEGPADLVCWNECQALNDDVALPYRVASRISALAYWSAADRYRVIDPMTALRERYETRPAERDDLDTAIRDTAAEFVGWFRTSPPDTIVATVEE